MNQQLIALLTEKFTKKLQAKTGWGRNEILMLHQEVVTEAALEILDNELK